MKVFGRMRDLKFFIFLGSVIVTAWVAFPAAAATTDDLMFIHHSCGQNWLDNSLRTALDAKSYVDEVNEITYGTTLSPDSGRPASLDSVPGENTDMHHWILWFNDYVRRVKSYGCASGTNRIILFKSCFPNSNIAATGAEPGDPFSDTKTIANYKAVYRHPTGGVYTQAGYIYKALEDVFAANPDILFIPVTAPPQWNSAISDADAHRARLFNNWLKLDWQTNYWARHPTNRNVAVFDWFNFLAYADNHSLHPNRLRYEFGGASGDSHPNDLGNRTSTWLFATSATNFIGVAWSNFYQRSLYAGFTFNAFALTNSVVLRWSSPQASGLSNGAVHLRFDPSTYPTGLSHGTELYAGTNRVYTHSDQASGATNYYTIWVSHDGVNFIEPP